MIRYRHPGVRARITPRGDGSVEVAFASPQSAVAPGQAVAFYDGDRLLGGGWIEAQDEMIIISYFGRGARGRRPLPPLPNPLPQPLYRGLGGEFGGGGGGILSKASPGPLPRKLPMPAFLIITFGCKVNQCDTAGMARELALRGWRAAAPGETPDLVVVNTCTVTARADQQARQSLRRLAREHPGTPLWVTGCYAQRAPAEVAALPGVQAVFGNQEKGRLAHLLSECGLSLAVDAAPGVLSPPGPADALSPPATRFPSPRAPRFSRPLARFSLPLDGGGLGWG